MKYQITPLDKQQIQTRIETVTYSRKSLGPVLLSLGMLRTLKIISLITTQLSRPKVLLFLFAIFLPPHPQQSSNQTWA